MTILKRNSCQKSATIAYYFNIVSFTLNHVSNELSGRGVIPQFENSFVQKMEIVSKVVRSKP